MNRRFLAGVAVGAAAILIPVGLYLRSVRRAWDEAWGWK